MRKPLKRGRPGFAWIASGLTLVAVTTFVLAGGRTAVGPPASGQTEFRSEGVQLGPSARLAAVSAGSLGARLPRTHLRTTSIVFGSGQTAYDARPLTRAIRVRCHRGELAISGGTVWSG